MNPALKWTPLVVALALATAGCARDGYYDDRNLDYGEAEIAEPLRLPGGGDAVAGVMPVPQGRIAASTEGAPRPAAGSAVRHTPEAFVESRERGDDRWLVVAAAPAAVWPMLEEFVERQGLTVTQRDARQGILATPQGRFTVQSALRGGASEVRCEAAGRSHAACLSALAGYFEMQGQSASASALAARAEASAALLAVQPAGEGWVLSVPADAERVWDELDHQLAGRFDDADFQRLLEGDATAREFRVAYLPQRLRGQGEGMLAALAIWRDDPEPRAVRLRVEGAGSEGSRVRIIEGLDGADQRELLERLADLLR
ncbi:lipoprotein, NlpB [Halomonas sp. H5]|uniref:lipoprotein, NlpB n=1 Tax=Halomonas sp. H5 TaxID=3423910 RepID=UPI003D360705